MSVAGPYAVVGPSGVGKDSVMTAVALACAEARLVRRVITRPSASGGEDFDGVTQEEFAARKQAGAFALDWEAHGLCYGIPATIHADLNAGHPVLFNGSRAMLTEAARVFPGLTVVHLTARDDVLAARLAARGRETAEQIAGRLARAKLPLPKGLNVIEIDNSGDLAHARDALIAALYPVRA